MTKLNLGIYFPLLLICLPVLVKAEICFKSFEEDTTIAQAIFVGKVVKIQRGQFWHKGTYKYQGEPKDVFTFKVVKSFKGLRPIVQYLSVIGPINGCCNEHFIKDSTFLVFAYGECAETELLWTNDCSNTGLLSDQMDLYRKLGTGVKHVVKDQLLETEVKRDSLLHTIDNLNSKIGTLKKENGRFSIFTILLTVLSFILLTLIVIMKREK
mgnify:CR=1 FL=1